MLYSLKRKLSATVKFLSKFTENFLEFIVDFGFNVPITHFLAALRKPESIIGVLLVGPLVGMAIFLLNPVSLLLGTATGLAVNFGWPALAVSGGISTGITHLPFIAGLMVNILTGITQSVYIKMKNQEELNQAYTGVGMLDYYGRKSVVEKKFPHALGPAPRALYYNFYSANVTSIPGHRPYNVAEIYWVPENMGGLKPRRPR